MARLIYASGKNSDMLYEVKIPIPDAFFLLDTGRKKYVFLDHREFEVFKKQNKDPKITTVLLNPLFEKALQADCKTSNANKLALYLLKKYKIKDRIIEVPASLPLDMADFLRSEGIKLLSTNPFFPQRMHKAEYELKHIKKSLTGIYKAYDKIKEILSESKIKGGRVVFQKRTLTSEMLKNEVDKVLLDVDMANVEGIIISSGSDAAIPHHMGSGPVRPHSTIICDIFPQNRTTKYFADLTRTFVKGQPGDEIMKMYEAVLKAQKEGIKAVKPGVKGSEVHKVCVQVFLEEGFDVDDKGFVHGTGHGFGIDVHEGPYLNKASQDILEPGNVVTVEPGLYYPNIGGVRIEDDVLVTEDGNKNLTRYSKEMIIL